MRCLHWISRTHTLRHSHRSRHSRTQTFRNKLFSAAPQFYQWNYLIAQGLHYLSQQGAGNIIVSKGIKATACYGGNSYIHSISLSLSLSSLSHMWTLDELHFSENRILKWRSLNCKLASVFRKQARLSTVKRGESTRAHGCQVDKDSSSSSSSSPLLSLVQVPAKLAINLSIHTQHTYDNGVDRTGDRVFRKYSFLHEEREEEKKFFNPQTMLHLEYSLRTEKKTPQHKSTYTINTWHCNRGKHIQLWQAAIRSSAMRRRSQTCSP